MNDSDLIKIAVLVVITYSVYMLCHVLQGSLVPDGIILSGVIGALCLIGGVRYERNRARYYVPGDEETEANVNQELP